MSTDSRVVTFGCRLNAFESEVIRRHLDDAGLADAIVVNTCAVTAEATRQARQAIRRLRRAHPDRRIVVTGCGAQVDTARFAAMPEVDHVIGNAEKTDPAALRRLATGAADRIVVSDVMELRETAAHLVEGPALDGFAGRHRAFVQIQQGCDHRCTFCIIPFARGPNRSVPARAVIRLVAALVNGGHAEVVLTGVDIASYGSEDGGESRLGGLVRDLLAAVPGLRRLRLSSLDPGRIDPALIDAFAEEPRLMPHVHWSLQSADDLVLKRMKRRHTRAQVAALCARLRDRRPEIAMGADIIAGFPTESAAMFANTLDAIDALGLSFLHVFPYSPRPGTPAARMPAVPAPERKRRAQLLRDAGGRALGRFFDSWVGRTVEVLVETDSTGRSEHYAPVRLDRPWPDGALVRARVTGRTDDALLATPVA